MRLRVLAVMGVCVTALMPLESQAQEADLLTGREAQRLLFKPKTGGSIPNPTSGLSESDQQLIATVAGQQKYYGAIAFSPDEGILSNATVAAANYHDVETASEKALSDCNGNRASGTARCVIAAWIVPPSYEEGRALQLNIDATAAVRKEYRRVRGEKAFAVSMSTGNWGYGNSDEAALQNCISKGADDCTLLLRN